MDYITPRPGESKRSIVGRNDLNVEAENRSKSFCTQFYHDAAAPLANVGVQP